jgi:hypothetical protein
MAGYSGTSLQKKLGIKPGNNIFVFQPPQEYWSWIAPLPPDVKVYDKMPKVADFVHLFMKEQKALEKQFKIAKQHLTKTGMIWISWPKKASKIATDLDENVIRDIGLQEGMVDVKVCAVDDVWSGLKFVFRIADR